MSYLSDSDHPQGHDVHRLTLSRRNVLKSITGTCVALAFGCDTQSGSGMVDTGDDPNHPDTPAAPALLALGQGISRSKDLEFAPYEGELPPVQGYTFVSGPNPWGDGTPIFNGDGAMLRVDVDGNLLRVKTRPMLTPCARLDKASSDTEFAYKNRAFVRESSAFGMRNFLNTSPVPTFDGRLMVTYDAGRPWEISPDDLSLTTPIGSLDEWRPMLPPVSDSQRFMNQSMSTAHPAYDEASRQVFSVNFAPFVEGVNIDPFFDLVWWSDDGVVKRAPLVNEDGSPCIIQMSCHQLHVTERFIVLIDSAVLVEPEQLFGLDVTRPQLSVTPIWVVQRDELVDGEAITAKSFVVESEAAHFLAAYDDQNGLDLLLVHQCSSDPSEWVREDDLLAHTGKPVHPSYVGLPVAGADRLWLGRYTIDYDQSQISLSKSLHGEEMWGLTLWTQQPDRDHRRLGEGWWITQGWHPDLYTQRIADTYKNQDHRTISISDMPDSVKPCRLMKIDHEALAIVDQYIFEDGYLPLSPTYMPIEADSQEETRGMILTLVQSPRGSELWFFDADRLDQGPLCKCQHDDLHFGHTLHSTWLSSINPPAASYSFSGDQELIDRFEYLSPEARSIAEMILIGN